MAYQSPEHQVEGAKMVSRIKDLLEKNAYDLGENVGVGGDLFGDGRKKRGKKSMKKACCSYCQGSGNLITGGKCNKCKAGNPCTGKGRVLTLAAGKKKRPLTEWQKCVKKYGSMKEASRHYNKKSKACKKPAPKKGSGASLKVAAGALAAGGVVKKKKRPLTDWQKCVKKYGSMKEASRHYNKKSKTCTKKSNLTEWEKCIKKYGTMEEAKKHYKKEPNAKCRSGALAAGALAAGKRRRKPNAWIMFLKANKGKGLSMTQLRARYKKGGAGGQSINLRQAKSIGLGSAVVAAGSPMTKGLRRPGPRKGERVIIDQDNRIIGENPEFTFYREYPEGVGIPPSLVDAQRPLTPIPYYQGLPSLANQDSQQELFNMIMDIKRMNDQLGAIQVRLGPNAEIYGGDALSKLKEFFKGVKGAFSGDLYSWKRNPTLRNIYRGKFSSRDWGARQTGPD